MKAKSQFGIFPKIEPVIVGLGANSLLSLAVKGSDKEPPVSPYWDSAWTDRRLLWHFRKFSAFCLLFFRRNDPA